MYASFYAHIRKFVPLTSDEEAILATYLNYEPRPKKAFILREGQTCTANYFILRGCVRMFFITDQGHEQITQFGIDNWWISDYGSLDRQTPSAFYIQALEPSELVVLERQVQDALFERLPQMERYFRIVLQRAYAASQMRLYFIYNQSGEQRYHQFNSAFPEFVQRIPQYMLASYLGFTPEFLSKIRRRRG
ncbi:Crp/Fnr family transcriptional regulator [Spirosoma koreense]